MRLYHSFHRFVFSFLKLPFIIFLMFATACGSITSLDPETGSTDGNNAGADGSDAEADSSVNETDAGSAIYVFSTDYASGGRLSVASAADGVTQLTDTGVDSLGSSAVVRAYDGLVYVLHDGFSAVSSDNLQIIDPDAGYATLGQFSTGNGTNPHDIVVKDGRAFITLYNPAADPENLDDEGLPGDVIEMDTATGEIVNRYSFYDYLTFDGDLNANADQMVLVGHTLYVALQDLASNTFAATVDGLIGMIDISANRVRGVIRLEGRNPVSLATNATGTRLAVANMATYDSSLGAYDTATQYGGLELVNLQSQLSLGLVDDEGLGGYIERVEADGENFYAIASAFDGASFIYSSKIIAFPQDDVTVGGAVTLDDSGTDIREIAINGGVLWVSRQINANWTISEPRIEAYDLNGGGMIGDALVPIATAVSMVAAP